MWGAWALRRRAQDCRGGLPGLRSHLGDMKQVGIDDWTTSAALRAAWRRVRARGGCAGADGVDVAAFGAALRGEIGALSAMLRQGRYRPRRLLRVPRPKPDGRTRWLSIPTVRDRVAQAALTAALDSVLDPQMSPASFAYRRGRSVEAAAGRVVALQLQGWDWAVHMDVEACFDRIPHAPLIDALRSAACPATLAVVERWLAGFGRGRGIAQGAPVSPLLMNWYLTPFDREIDRGRARLVRYADDMLILTRSASRLPAARARAEAALSRLSLTTNPAKTRTGRLTDGMDFLGLRFQGGAVARV